MAQCWRARLEPCQTSTMERFCKNSSRLSAVNYVHKNVPMFRNILNTPADQSTLNRITNFATFFRMSRETNFLQFENIFSL